MLSALPLTLLSLLAQLAPGPSRSLSLPGPFFANAGLLVLLQRVGAAQAVSVVDKRANLQTSSNGSSFIWTIEDTYAGQTFFECVLGYLGSFSGVD